jgi:hypothetical protein
VGREGEFPTVQPQTGLPCARVGAVAGIAVFRKNRLNSLVERQFSGTECGGRVVTYQPGNGDPEENSRYNPQGAKARPRILFPRLFCSFAHYALSIYLGDNLRLQSLQEIVCPRPALREE